MPLDAHVDPSSRTTASAGRSRAAAACRGRPFGEMNSRKRVTPASPTADLESAQRRLSALERRLDEAVAERDAALAALAREREGAQALRLAAAAQGEPEPKPYPKSAGPEAPPLRYVVADSVNDGLKRFLAPLRQGAKALAAWGRRSQGRR